MEGVFCIKTVLDFFGGKRVLVTGHTGFKGAWLCQILKMAGAKVTGYALSAEKDSFYNTIGTYKDIESNIGDIRDYVSLSGVFREARPEIVLHLAAQPLVLDSYKRPGYTFDTNLTGTVNLFECIRLCDTVRSVVIVTSDKVYKNLESDRGYIEEDPLGGNDPYSASKACVEIVCASYGVSFFQQSGIPVSSARAGNVIGGGDAAKNRIVPDCIRAAVSGKKIPLRNPNSVRPYQHVIEPLFAYLFIAMRQCENPGIAGSYNIGPNREDCISTGRLADIFCDKWGGMSWEHVHVKDAPEEAELLYLDCAKIYKVLGWCPVWNIEKAVQKVVEWERRRDLNITNKQISEYMADYESMNREDI